MSTRWRKCSFFYCVALIATGWLAPLPAQATLYPSFADFQGELLGLGNIVDPTERAAAVDTFWTGLRNAGAVPYTQGNRYAFLYRGSGGSIAFPGDLNRWNPTDGLATQVPGTDLWYRLGTLPEDGRVDYKLYRNGAWLLDPFNPLQQWSGFGPNSELRMPGYVFPEETVRRTGVERGTLSSNQRLSSAAIGSDVNVRVYTPAGYDALADLPTVYVTDGHEYADDRLGAMTSVLDNLIDSGELRPVIAVFIDPRDPNTGTNRRGDQLGGSGKAAFSDFIADELVPYVDANYRTIDEADQRVILGTSLGGLFSAFMGARHPDVIANLAIQSPAFWFDPTIYNLYDDNTPLADALRIYMHTGTVFDDGGGSTMAALLNDDGYNAVFDWVNQGHSWGHWKGELDSALVHLLGSTPIPEPSAAVALLALAVLRRNTASGH